MSELLRTVVSVVATADPDRGLPDEIAARVEPYGGRPLGPSAPGEAHVGFDTPTDAVRFSVAVRAAAVELGATVCIGVDLGPEIPNGRNGAVGPDRIAPALAAYAAGGEILVTDVVRRLSGPVAGVHYIDRGRVRPPGLDDRHQLHAVAAGPDHPDAGPVFGRDVELAATRELLQRAADGNGAVLVLEGPAGIGKSHLARAAQAEARRRGMRVVVAAADEIRQDGAAVLVAGLAAGLGIRDIEGRDIDGRTGSGRDGSGDPAFAVIERVVAAVHDAAGVEPLLVVVEDVHWADEMSIRALRTVSRSIGPLPVGLVVTARPEPRSPRLAECLDVLDAQPGAHLRLGPLDDLATSGLVTARTGAAAGPGLRARLEATGGNPLFVTELVRSLEEDGRLRIERGVVEIEGDDDPTGPARHDSAVTGPDPAGGVSATIHRRQTALPPTTNEILRLASLLGTTFSLEDLATVAARRVVDVAADLTPALDAELVSGDGDRLAFRHDLVREAIHRAIPDAIRRDLHVAAGRSLARAGAGAATVAGQFSMGAKVGDRLAVDWLVRAAEETQGFDTRTAVTLYQRALGLVPPGDAPTRDRIESLLVELLAWSGRLQEAESLASELLSRSLTPEQELAARRALASTLATRGDLVAAADACLAAVAAADTDEAHVLRSAAAGMQVIAGQDAENAIEIAGEAAASEQRAPACWAEQTLGIAALSQGRYEDARGHLGRSRALLDSGFVRPLGFLIPHTWEAGTLAYVDRFDESEVAWRQARDRSEARGDIGMLVQAHTGLGLMRFIAGDWDEAEAEMGALMSVAEETGADPQPLLSAALLAGIDHDRGRRAEADEHVRRGWTALESGSLHLFGAELWAWQAARLAMADGDDDQARAILEMAWTQIEPIMFLLQWASVLPVLVDLRRRTGDVDGAMELAEVARAGAARTGVDIYRAAELRCRGLATGDPDLLVEAATIARTSPRRPELATILEETARLLVDAGRADEAVPLVDEAVAVVETIGAEGWTERLTALVPGAAPSARPSRDPTATHGWASLSPKELEVVALVAEGLSNPQIGERLFISRRTVESHLSHVFRKLDLSNRTQLARVSLEREV